MSTSKPGAPERPLPKKERLEELLALAQTYRGWTLREVAQRLGRDPHKLVPESGIPKLDLVMRLAEALDWSVDQVARDLCDLSSTPTEPAAPRTDFKSLDRRAFEAYEEGRFDDVERFATEAFAAAGTPNERARALMRQCAAHDARGLYAQALGAAQQGLKEIDASFEYHLSFRVNLANAHYTLGNLYEAEAVANSLVEWFSANPMPSPLSRSTKAFAYYVRGSCHRCFAGLNLANAGWHAQRGREDLMQAERLFDEYAAGTGIDTYGGYANICRGGALELAPMLGVEDAAAVVARFESEVESALEATEEPRGAWMESWGWWCVFGCNVAMRHLSEDAGLERAMEHFLRHAERVAESLGNWALRERVWTLELQRRQRRGDAGEPRAPWTVDAQGVRSVTGTMARFPEFRDVGWQVLRSTRRPGS